MIKKQLEKENEENNEFERGISMGTGFDIQTEKRKLLAKILGLMCALSFNELDCKAQDDIEDIFEELI